MLHVLGNKDGQGGVRPLETGQEKERTWGDLRDAGPGGAGCVNGQRQTAGATGEREVARGLA